MFVILTCPTGSSKYGTTCLKYTVILHLKIQVYLFKMDRLKYTFFSLIFVDGVVLIEPDYVKDGKKGKQCFKFSAELPAVCVYRLIESIAVKPFL